MIVQYKIIVDTQDRSHPTKNKKTYLLNIDELLTDGTDSDKLVITKDNDYVLRYFKASEFNVMSKLDTPYKEPIDININLFEGTNFVYIENITGEDIYAEYIIKNDFTDVYVTKNTMNSTISESIDKIELSISQKLTDYSKTNDMDDAINTAVKKAKDDINSTTDNKLKDYATTKEMNAAIKLSTDGIEQKVSEKLTTYSTTDEMNNAINIAQNDSSNDTDNKLKAYPTTEEMESKIAQTSNSITLGVSKKLNDYYYTKSEIDITNKEIKSTVSEKVGNDEVISKINQSAEKIQISATKLDLEGYATFSDLSTSGKTTINGDNITTGTIKSKNYAVDENGNATAGTQINLTNGIIDSKNFTLDSKGNVNVSGLLTTGKGIYTNLHTVGALYQRNNLESGMDFFGIMENNYGGTGDITKTQLCFFIYVPTGFVVEEAYINLTIIPIKWNYLGTEYWGYARNIGLYKGKIPDSDTAAYASEAYSTTYNIGTKIDFLSDSSNWKPEDDNTLSTNHKKVSKTSKNISSEITTGNNFLIIQTDNNPSISDDMHELAEQTGKALGFLDIYGYLPR